MASSGELPLPLIENVPNLGDLPLDQQRDRLLGIYASQDLLGTDTKPYITDNPLADIIKMRYVAITPYVDSVKERMRQGAVSRIVIDTEISASDLFERLRAVDGQDRDVILTRSISRARLDEALRSGSDRDEYSNKGYHGGDYENTAMKEYALTVVGDVTYASRTRSDSPAIRVSPHSALLIYANEALQEIAPRTRHIMGSTGFHVFVDPRLKWCSLLATVESSEASRAMESRIGSTAVSQLSYSLAARAINTGKES